MANQFWNDPKTILYMLIVFLVIINIWNMYLLLREISVCIQNDEVPEVLEPYMKTEVYKEMRAIKIQHAILEFWSILILVVIIGCLELYLGLYAYFWTLAVKACVWEWTKREVWISLVYVLILTIYFTVKNLPVALYDKKCISRSVKRKKSPLCRRICRAVFDIIISLALIFLLTAIYVLVINALGKYLFVGLVVITIGISILITIIVPLLIEPLLFGKQMKLKEGPLRKLIKDLTDFLGFPIDNVRIVKNSDPNRGGNAFFYGCLCLKRIIIFDTLLLNRGVDPKELPPEERGKGLPNRLVVAVVAHELGHWKHGHFYKMVILVKLHLLLLLFLFSLCFHHGPIYEAVGFEKGVMPVIAGLLIIFGYVLLPYTTIMNFFMLITTRHFERQADRFAHRLGHGQDLGNALLKIYADNRNFPISDKCYSAWHYTHPTMLERLEYLQKLDDERTSSVSTSSKTS